MRLRPSSQAVDFLSVLWIFSGCDGSGQWRAPEERQGHESGAGQGPDSGLTIQMICGDTSKEPTQGLRSFWPLSISGHKPCIMMIGTCSQSSKLASLCSTIWLQGCTILPMPSFQCDSVCYGGVKVSLIWIEKQPTVKMDMTVEQLGMIPPRPRPVKYPAKQ